jgi:hypothetical protein
MDHRFGRRERPPRRLVRYVALRQVNLEEIVSGAAQV